MAEEFDWGNFLNKAAERGADTLGNMIDSAARGGSVVSILGSGLSGALDTPGNQERKESARIAALKRQYYENELKDQPNQRKMAREKHEADMKSRRLANELAQKKSEDYEYTRNSRNYAEEEQNRNRILREQLVRNSLYDGMIKEQEGLTEKLWERNAQYNQLGLDAKDDFRRSVEYRSDKEVGTAYRLYKLSQEKPEYREVLNRYLSRNGMSLTTDEDGGETLHLGDGRTIPVTVDNFGKVVDFEKGELDKELQNRLMLSGARDNVMKNVMMRTVSSSAGAFGNSYTKTLDAYRSFLSQYPERDRTEYLLVNAYEDAMSDGRLTEAEKNQIIPQALALAEKSGLRLDSERLTVLNEDGSSVPLQKYIDGLKERNPIDRDWNSMITGIQREKMLRTKKKDKGSFWDGDGETDAGPDVRAELKGKLKQEYGAAFEHTEKVQDKIADTYKAFMGEISSDLQKYGVKSAGELPEEALKNLDAQWNNKMKEYGLNPKTLYSPVDKYLRPYREKRKKETEESRKKREERKREVFRKSKIVKA